ncbi:hypothetical protein COL22_23195 [Bacillus thuringiensis]|uniref:hypothetical protein n=1 Tax=Bacillus thuringiensis TaxID=1428 RepID=UPI000BF7536C|nr:hypothetical protein [Bacillus thuringiensis]PFW05313.1 hypothetical protein COL22_23195 [Bacillus thuringiensis]
MNMTEFQKEFLDKPEFKFESKTESITIDSYEFKDFSFDYFSGLCDTNNIKHISLNHCIIEKSIVIFNREIEISNSIFTECHFDFKKNKDDIQHFVSFKSSSILDSNIDLNQFNSIAKIHHVTIKKSDQISFINANSNNNFEVIDKRNQTDLGSFNDILIAESVVKISDATFKANELNKTPNLKYNGLTPSNDSEQTYGSILINKSSQDLFKTPIINPTNKTPNLKYDDLTPSKNPEQSYGSDIINKEFQDISNNTKIEPFFDGLIDNSFKKNPIFTLECLKHYIAENHADIHLIESVSTEKFTVKFEKLSETLLVSKNTSPLDQKEALKDIANEIHDPDNTIKLSNVMQDKQNQIEQKQAISFER